MCGIKIRTIFECKWNVSSFVYWEALKLHGSVGINKIISADSDNVNENASKGKTVSFSQVSEICTYDSSSENSFSNNARINKVQSKLNGKNRSTKSYVRRKSKSVTNK